MPINWTDGMSVNVKEIDDQHQYFLNMLNDLYQAHYFRKELVLGDAVNKLAAYAKLHFSTEEKYFDQFHYDGAEEHKRIHRDLLGKVAGFVARYERGETNIIGEMVEFLEAWLVDHLIIEDKKYTRCFNEHGLY
ncbi:MAG: bacteriohemerythrin [Candidatus Margulisbacteria bacterium]|nr:bacteriohemerythrin [Candidatus Margulisiibacteriota bacterium]